MTKVFLVTKRIEAEDMPSAIAQEGQGRIVEAVEDKSGGSMSVSAIGFNI